MKAKILFALLVLISGCSVFYSAVAIDNRSARQSAIEEVKKFCDVQSGKLYGSADAESFKIPGTAAYFFNRPGTIIFGSDGDNQCVRHFVSKAGYRFSVHSRLMD